MQSIITINQVKDVVKQLHSQHKSIVVAGGCFDLLHIGHITLLENAKKQADTLIVLLESDKAIKKRKGINRPIHSQQERAHMLSALQAVDVVVLLPETMYDADYDNVINIINPAIIATTENDSFIAHKKRQASLVGGKVVAVNEYHPSVSTTKLLTILEKEI